MTASRMVMTATQATSDKKIVDSVLVDVMTGRKRSLMLSNLRDASAASLLTAAKPF